MTDIQSFEIRDFAFENGTVLPSAKLCYLDLNPEHSKTALVITCFRGRLQQTTNFADGALKDHRVIVVALFGNGESSSPSNSQSFPEAIRYTDCVRAQKELLTSHLGLQSVDVVLGFSMGGQCTYHWSVMYPEFVRNAVIICSSARTSRHNYQFLEGPKAALENAIDYVDKSLAPASEPSRGLRAFGKSYSAWLTSAEWFDQEQYKSLGYESLEAWDRDITFKGYTGWNPEDLLAMLHMWQAGDIATAVPTGDKTLEAALSSIRARVLLMPCQTDQYFRPDANERESRLIPDVTLEVIPSIWGHVAGGGANPVDKEWMDGKIRAFLGNGSSVQ
jgi:homoserine O-acetyltransferase